jgi:hypothetical protein
MSINVGMKGEVNRLRLSTATKYEEAETATTTAKPSELAKLFQIAQDEATLLAQNEQILKGFEDVEQAMNIALRKAADSVRGMQASVQELKDAELEQQEGYKMLTDGIAVSSKSFEGSKTFKMGIVKILRAQGRDTSVFRGLSKDIR